MKVRELVLLFSQSVGDGVPLGFGLGLAFLGEDRLEHRGHGRALLGRSVRQGVAHPVNPTALMVALKTRRGEVGGVAEVVEIRRRCNLQVT